MNTNKKKLTVYLFLGVILSFGLSLYFQSLVLAWTSPASPPPDGNFSPPLFNDGGNVSFPSVNRSLTMMQGFYIGINKFFAGADGKVGIGTEEPAHALDVTSGIINANGGLIIETRNSDPENPVHSQIWLIVD